MREATFSFVDVPLQNGIQQAFVARPASLPTAAVLLLPEIYNQNEWIRAVAMRYAEHGFLAVVPDLYWRVEAGLHFPYTPEGQTRGMALGFALDLDQSIADLGAVVEWIKGSTGLRVFSTGFCLGGKLTVLSAAAGQVEAAVAYYPTQLEKHLDALQALDVHTVLQIGTADPYTPETLITSIASIANPNIAIHAHDGIGHGFARFGHPPFHADAAASAERDTFERFDTLLRNR